MKKFMNYLFLTLLLILPISVQAKEETAYFIGSKELKPGDTATYYLGFQSSELIEGIQYQIQTSGSIELESMDAVNGTTISKMGESVSQTSKKGLKSGIAWAKITVRVPNEAEIDSTGEFIISNIGISLKGQSSTVYASNASYEITIKETVEPTQKEEIIESFNLLNVNSFTFDPDLKKYQLTVPYEETSLNFDIILNGEGTSYVIEDNNLVVGKNIVSVHLLDENGLGDTYEFEVIREENQGEPIICEECKTCHDLTWIIISSVLGVLVITETFYIAYLKKEQ